MDSSIKGGTGSSPGNAEAAAPRTVDMLVTPDGNVWEMRCGHCGKIERYASEKEALDAAHDHSRALGLNEEPQLRVERGDADRES